VVLFAPLSSEQAEAIKRGDGLPEVEFLLADRPLRERAGTDGLWIAIDVPDAEAAAYEVVPPPELGYREFTLEGSDFRRYRVWLMDRLPEPG
jgi:hypothetical protein